VVNHDASKYADVYIEDSVIKQVGSHLIIPGGTRVIDALGKLVIPGGIDPNVHLQTPVDTSGTQVPSGTRTLDDFYSGTKAALAGGTTTIIDTVLPQKDESLVQGIVQYVRENCQATSSLLLQLIAAMSQTIYRSLS
jgi:dihydropyrimidinase